MHIDYLISTKQYISHSTKWHKWIDRGDSICLIFPYMSDRLVRLEQFTSELKQEPGHYSIVIDPTISYFDSYVEFKNYLSKAINLAYPDLDYENLKAHEKLTIVIVNGDGLLPSAHQKTLDYLQHLATEYLSVITFIISYETDVFIKLKNYNSYSLLFQNVDYYPLYDLEDTEKFIEFLSTIWKISIPNKIADEIAAETLGSFWLTKQAIRIFVEQNLFDTNDPTLSLRLKGITEILSDEEVEILGNHNNISKYKNSNSYNHLKKLGLLNENNICSIKSLLPYLESRLKMQFQLSIANGEIFWQNRSISHLISKHEASLLSAMIQSPNISFSRDQIAKYLWPENTEEHFSPWAIDQTMKRLRDKLVKLGLPATTIKSIRGVGYEYRN